MVKTLIFTIALAWFSVGVAQDPIGVINDPKGEVIIRSGKGPDFGLSGRLKEGQKFKYWPEDESSWWYVETIVDHDDPISGFVYKSKIQPYYPAKQLNHCDCLNGVQPVFSHQIGNQQIVICGELLQRNQLGEIIIRNFSVINCESATQLAYYGVAETCKVSLVDKRLNIISLKKLPVGDKWEIKRAPISSQILQDDLTLSQREIVVDTRISNVQTEEFLAELVTLKDKGFIKDTPYPLILLKLLSAGLAGNSAASDLLREADSFFGFEVKMQYYREYNLAIALLDWIEK